MQIPWRKKLQLKNVKAKNEQKGMNKSQNQKKQPNQNELIILPQTFLSCQQTLVTKNVKQIIDKVSLKKIYKLNQNRLDKVLLFHIKNKKVIKRPLQVNINNNIYHKNNLNNHTNKKSTYEKQTLKVPQNIINQVQKAPKQQTIHSNLIQKNKRIFLIPAYLTIKENKIIHINPSINICSISFTIYLRLYFGNVSSNVFKHLSENVYLQTNRFQKIRLNKSYHIINHNCQQTINHKFQPTINYKFQPKIHQHSFGINILSNTKLNQIVYRIDKVFDFDIKANCSKSPFQYKQIFGSFKLSILNQLQNHDCSKQKYFIYLMQHSTNKQFIINNQDYSSTNGTFIISSSQNQINILPNNKFNQLQYYFDKVSKLQAQIRQLKQKSYQQLSILLIPHQENQKFRNRQVQQLIERYKQCGQPQKVQIQLPRLKVTSPQKSNFFKQFHQKDKKMIQHQSVQIIQSEGQMREQQCEQNVLPEQVLKQTKKAQLLCYYKHKLHIQLLNQISGQKLQHNQPLFFNTLNFKLTLYRKPFIQVFLLGFLSSLLSILNLAVYFQSIDNINVVIGLEGIILVGIIIFVNRIVYNFIHAYLMVTLVILQILNSIITLIYNIIKAINTQSQFVWYQSPFFLIVIGLSAICQIGLLILSIWWYLVKIRRTSTKRKIKQNGFQKINKNKHQKKRFRRQNWILPQYLQAYLHQLIQKDYLYQVIPKIDIYAYQDSPNSPKHQKKRVNIQKQECLSSSCSQQSYNSQISQSDFDQIPQLDQQKQVKQLWKRRTTNLQQQMKSIKGQSFQHSFQDNYQKDKYMESVEDFGDKSIHTKPQLQKQPQNNLNNRHKYLADQIYHTILAFYNSIHIESQRLSSQQSRQVLQQNVMVLSQFYQKRLQTFQKQQLYHSFQSYHPVPTLNSLRSFQPQFLIQSFLGLQKLQQKQASPILKPQSSLQALNLRFISSQQLIQKRRNIDLLEDLNIEHFSQEQLIKLGLKHKFYNLLIMNKNDVLIMINNYVKHKIQEIQYRQQLYQELRNWMIRQYREKGNKKNIPKTFKSQQKELQLLYKVAIQFVIPSKVSYSRWSTQQSIKSVIRIGMKQQIQSLIDYFQQQYKQITPTKEILFNFYFSLCYADRISDDSRLVLASFQYYWTVYQQEIAKSYSKQDFQINSNRLSKKGFFSTCF